MPKLYVRKQVEVNTDPQRRCYYGCHFSSEWQWQPWESLGEADEAQLKYFIELNDYAVSQRGPGARCEYKLVDE